MARPSQDEIDTYMTITGASESLARQKLEEHGGNLNEAVNSFYGGEDIHITNPPQTPYPAPQQHNIVHSDNNNDSQSGRGLFPMLSAARSFKPSLLLDPNYRREIYSRISAAGSSLLSPPSTATVVPSEPSYNSHDQVPYSGPRPNVGNDHMPTGYDDNHVEDEIIQAVIRDSLRDSEVSSGSGHSERQFHQEEDDLARAFSLSLETAEKEKAIREQRTRDYSQELGVGRRSKPESSSNQKEAQNVEVEQQLRQKSDGRKGNHPQQHKDEASRFEEWGDISSKELEEALMVEATLFSSTSGGLSNSAPTQFQGGEKNSTVSDQASRSLKEQQDKEYHESLLLDKQKQEESQRKMLSELNWERTLASKKASLSCEPGPDDENSVTLLIRMPNGNRSGRRFLKSDKLQLLFDFIDIGEEVKPGTYRVVRSYPRRAFTLDESLLTLTEVGLINKQEVLFLELI